MKLSSAHEVCPDHREELAELLDVGVEPDHFFCRGDLVGHAVTFRAEVHNRRPAVPRRVLFAQQDRRPFRLWYQMMSRYGLLGERFGTAGARLPEPACRHLHQRRRWSHRCSCMRKSEEEPM